MSGRGEEALEAEGWSEAVTELIYGGSSSWSRAEVRIDLRTGSAEATQSRGKASASGSLVLDEDRRKELLRLSEGVDATLKSDLHDDPFEFYSTYLEVRRGVTALRFEVRGYVGSVPPLDEIARLAGGLFDEIAPIEAADS